MAERLGVPCYSNSMKYHRILLKLSGEQFAGSRDSGIDVSYLEGLARQLKAVRDAHPVELAIVVGGGNFMRGATIAAAGIERATGDYMGMLATIMNGMALVDVLEHAGQPARLMTRVRAENVAEPYIRRRGIRHMEKGRVIVVAGGTGNPYVTTDTAAVSAALELNCQIVMKATKVDGVYDSDPAANPEARRLDSVTYVEALANPAIKVMDKTAVSLALDNKMPLLIFNLNEPEALNKAVAGDSVGTFINR